MKKLLIGITLAGLSACAVNPVTGDRQFMTVSPADDIALGTQNYAPMVQSQGGTYDVDTELTAYVQSVGKRLAAVSDVALPYEFTVLNSSVPNAWALPGGKIAVNRGLLVEIQSEAELAAVLGHEITHAAARHTAQQMSRAQILQGLVVATSVVSSDSSYGNLAVGGASVAAQLVSTKYGREAELEADKYGMRYMSKAGYDPQGAVTLQETFVRLSEGRNQSWLNGLFASHPPSQERVTANRERIRNLPAGGTLGVDAYRAAMQKTLDAKPAYDAYDAGRKALGEKKADEALALADKAIESFSAEANFHALRGDVRLMNKQYDMAVTNYDRAISRRGNFFYYPLQRGLANKELGKTDAAVADLERSLSLLPTAPAHYHLGLIKKDRGDTAAAIEHFRVVAKSGGDYGKAASGQLARLELAENPAAYVSRACGAGNQGQLMVSVRNDAPLAITAVQVQVDYTDSAGRAQQLRRNVGGRLEPGQVATADTGLAPYSGSGCPAKVISARIAE
ncbi:MAG: M48 family metalloprotease [Gammaproteobacteria bacterium]|nr:M48 family metalloprotease [Gammaproteobacteria bacterium]MDH5323496.1 M48 family metalloprotease [Gammaproteobacteria bacterium]